MSAAKDGDYSLLVDYYVETTRLHVERTRHYETQSQSLMAVAGTLLGIIAATAAAADPPLLPVILAVLPLSLAVVCSAQSRQLLRPRPRRAPRKRRRRDRPVREGRHP